MPDTECIMRLFEEFKAILKDMNIEVPEESLEVLYDLVETQTDLILEKWIEDEIAKKQHDEGDQQT